MDGGDAAACEEADGSETTGGALQTDGSDAAACEEADGSETTNGTLNAQRVQLAHVEARQVHFNICARMGGYGGLGGAQRCTPHSVRLIRPLRGGKGTCTREHVRTIPSALKLLLVLLDIVDAAIVVVRLD